MAEIDNEVLTQLVARMDALQTEVAEQRQTIAHQQALIEAQQAQLNSSKALAVIAPTEKPRNVSRRRLIKEMTAIAGGLVALNALANTNTPQIVLAESDPPPPSTTPVPVTPPNGKPPAPSVPAVTGGNMVIGGFNFPTNIADVTTLADPSGTQLMPNVLHVRNNTNSIYTLPTTARVAILGSVAGSDNTAPADAYYVGVWGANIRTTGGPGANTGVQGESNAGNGVVGVSYSSADSGVFAANFSGTGGNWGVRADNYSKNGTGVFGYVFNQDATGFTTGVSGLSTSPAGKGVYGEGKTYGVEAITSGTSGIAVRAVANSTTGLTFGVRAESFSPSGTGVSGIASATSGDTVGVRGSVSSSSFQSYGVYGSSTSGTGVYGTGNDRGVYGVTTSGTGVRGNSTNGTGVAGSSTNGDAVSASTVNGSGIYASSDKYYGATLRGGKAPLFIISPTSIVAGPPTDTYHLFGELYVDHKAGSGGGRGGGFTSGAGDLWYCQSNETDGTSKWVKLNNTVNGLANDVSIEQGSGITVTTDPATNKITIANTGNTVAGVSSVNGIGGAVSLVAGTNVNLVQSGNSITINSTGGGGGSGSFNFLPQPVRIAATIGSNRTPILTGTGSSPAPSSSNSVLIQATGAGKVPTGAKGIVGVLTNVGATSGGNLRFWAGNTVPDAVNLNVPGANFSLNLSASFAIPLDSNGQVYLGWSAGLGSQCGYAVDVTGYYL